MVLDRLASVPGLAELRAAAERRGGGMWLVGGAVRDALLGAPVRDLDVVVGGDALAVARELGEVLAEHERFGTAEILAGGGRVNLAAARTERYAHPGALPEVRLGATIEEDLRRRDFTVNAIAVALDDGRVVAWPGARDDLDARLLRVLHDASFADDPTRLHRMVRYAVRLGLEPEPHTARLARAADWRTASGDRIAAEVRLMLAEPDPVATLVAGAAWIPGGVPRVDPALARAALELLPPDGRADVVLVATDPDPAGWMRRLGEPESQVRRAAQAARAPALAARLSAAARPSEIAEAVRGWPVEAIALAGAQGAREPARRWLDELRHVRLEIDGRDVVAAGIPQGPEVGRALERALGARLDGMLPPGRDAEIRAALGR